MTDGYNGWKNWETWNVALWLSNDEGLYNQMRWFARRDLGYVRLSKHLVEAVGPKTPDGAYWTDEDLDTDALDSMMEEEKP